MRRRLIGLLTALCGGLALSGCIWVTSHSAFQRIHDDQVTFDDFNDTMDFEPGDDAAEAFPPLPVHEFDHDSVADAGGYRVIDGFEWFGADLEERNDLLKEVQETMPQGSVIMIEVATGEVWVVPPDGYESFLDGTVTAWSEDEYDDLPDYVRDDSGFGYYGPSIGGYRQLTAIDAGGITPVYLHPLVRSAIARLQAANAFSFAPAPNWRTLSPGQRLALLLNLRNYLLMTAYYRSNPFLLGVSIPNGGIYAFPDLALWELAYRYAAKAWTPQEIVMLTSTGILPAIVTLRRAEILRRVLEPQD